MNDFLTRCNELADTMEKKMLQQQTQIERLTAVNYQLNEQSSSLQTQLKELQSENERLEITNGKQNTLLKAAAKRLGL